MTSRKNCVKKLEIGSLDATSASRSARGIDLREKGILPSRRKTRFRPLTDELLISTQEFNQRFKRSPVKRAKRRGYLRNVAVALGNTGDMHALPVLQNALNDEEPMVREHAQWAIEEISIRENRHKGRELQMNKLLIATNNKGKIKELQELLKDMGIQLVTPADINLDLDVHEDGSTYAENAAKKAIAFAQASGLISLADDSGLEVDALGGAPGLYSARYGSTNGGKLSDAERRQFLLQKLARQTPPVDSPLPRHDCHCNP